ncbi:hypothetical protein L204_102796 [Cryptococcus depauperatus]
MDQSPTDQTGAGHNALKLFVMTSPDHLASPAPPVRSPSTSAFPNGDPHAAYKGYLPGVSSTPPPNPPPYIPPPQHALPPDPIHLLSAQPQWNTVPQNGWRVPQGPSSFAAYRARPSGTRYTGGRPGSAQDSRDKRRRDRDKERDDEREIEEEVISTIFVVGFPEDMSEREFQNIFSFASGFEAATLKFPSGSSRAREPAAALLAELQALAANQAQGGEGLEGYAGNLEEAFSSLTLATASTSQSTTPSAPVSLTPSAPSTAHLSSSSLPPLPTNSGRRQTIGFARFKTRVDALAARDHLQGKKIDQLTGATLKAEMAKKNLHTKKSSGEELVGFLLRGRLGLPAAGSMSAQETPVQAQVTTQVQGAREAWEAWQSDTPSEQGNLPFLRNEEAKNSHQAHSAPFGSTQPTLTPIATSQIQKINIDPAETGLKSPGSQRPTDSKALLALAEEADALEGWNVGSVGMLNYPTQSHPPQQTHQPHSVPPRRALGSQSSVTPTTGGYGLGSSNSGFGRDYGEMEANPGSSAQANATGAATGGASGLGGRALGTNPADQNPPINTLYVGNLPAVSPPTHPPNFLEESLRALFSRCPGFKRMSYRQKINGPMCFVEFDEVGYAGMAIKDLYGHNLGGLVKGGIRLSYSKNSLGQRGSYHPSQINTSSASLYSGLAHNVPLAGMGMSSPTSASHTLPPTSEVNGTALGPVGSGGNSGSASAGAGGFGFGNGFGGAMGGLVGPASAPVGETRRESATTSTHSSLSNGTLTANGPSPSSVNSAAQSGSAHGNSGFGPNMLGTSLSPTAQPFNISPPLTSPRSRYFASLPLSSGQGGQGQSPQVPGKLSPTESSSSYTNPTSNSMPTTSGVGIPIPTTFQTTFKPFDDTSVPSSSTSLSTSIMSGFSPVSPFRIPTSSWVSSSVVAGSSAHDVGSRGKGVGSIPLSDYPGFGYGGSVPLGSLNGAASAWGHSERRD